ncbi:hypothetical protein OAN61_01060 [bacterium]|nr:hypothetical protein [bacterium]
MPSAHTKITVDDSTDKITPYVELMKGFGKVGSTIHNDLLNPTNYLVDLTGSTGNFNGNVRAKRVAAFAPYALDLESFRHEIENGVDTASKALPMSLDLDQSGTASVLPIQIFII